MKTKKIRGRTLLCVLLALVIAMGSVSVVSAKTLLVTLNNTRISNTLAETTTHVTFSEDADYCTAKVVLEEKYSGGWRTATGLPVVGVTTSKTNSDYIYLAHDFTLIKGTVYRTKATFSDTIDSVTYTSTYYGPLF